MQFLFCASLNLYFSHPILPDLPRPKSNGGDVDKAKSDTKKVGFDSISFALISTRKAKLHPYNPSQQILVSVTFLLAKLHLHVFPTRGLITCQKVLPSHLRAYTIEFLNGAVKQLSLDTSPQ